MTVTAIVIATLFIILFHNRNRNLSETLVLNHDGCPGVVTHVVRPGPEP